MSTDLGDVVVTSAARDEVFKFLPAGEVLGENSDIKNTAITPFTPVSNDIGHYIDGDQTIDDFTKKTLLENPWMPLKNYAFPYSTRIVKNNERKHYVSHTHLEDHKEWLVLSNVKKGLFCKFCPWFVNRHEGGFKKNVRLGVLVSEPLINFKKLTGKDSELLIHSQNQYYKDAVVAGKNFLKNFDNPALEIHNRLNTNYLAQVRENIERLIPIVKIIILCGKQNISLRGHRDDGIIEVDSPPANNEGNFRALLQFRVDAGDKTLEDHLRKSSSRATYISKTTQNYLIECCRLEILDIILKKVERAGFYSVIFDETGDLSGKSQVTLVLRYVDFSADVPCIREDFVSFIDAFGELLKRQQQNDGTEGGEDTDNSSSELDASESECEENNAGASTTSTDVSGEELSMTGVAVGSLVIQEMKNMNLNFENCVGIGTDGCSVMLSDECGAVKEVQKVAKNALKTPCYNHKLNNSLAESAKILIVEKASSIIKEQITLPKAQILC